MAELDHAEPSPFHRSRWSVSLCSHCSFVAPS
jgi:hypothetical protein